MTNKTALKRLKLDPYFSKTIETNLNVWSHDVNSFEIKFEFYDHKCDKPIDLTGADMRILLDHADSHPKVYPLEIESKILGLAKFVMPKEIRGCEGKFTAHIYADYPNKTHDFGSFIFYTQLSRIDKGMGGCLDTVYVSEFEKALQDIKDKSTQFDNVEEELNKRIDVIEKDIASNDIAKNSELQPLKKDFYGMNIGGVNLITESSEIKKEAIWTDNVNVIAHKDIKISPERQYVASVFYDNVNNDFKSPVAIRFLWLDSSKKFIGESDDGLIKVNNGEKGYASVTATSPKGAAYAWLSLRLPGLKPNNGSVVGSATYREETMQLGNTPVGWLPQLGTKTDINNLQKQIDDIKKAITTLGGTL